MLVWIFYKILRAIMYGLGIKLLGNERSFSFFIYKLLVAQLETDDTQSSMSKLIKSG